MIKIMRAVAAVMLLATGAQAAVVGPSVEAVSGEPGAFDFYTGTTMYTTNPAIKSYSLKLYVTSTPIDTIVLSTIGGGDPREVPFRFNWAGGVADDLLMKAVIGYYDSPIVPVGSQAGSTTYGIVGSRLFEETIILSAATKAATSAPTAMPIGGTLPLMLSALGLGALVMRRRAKAALA